MVKTRRSMDSPAINDVLEPKIGDLPEETSAAALPVDEPVPQMQDEAVQEGNVPLQAPEPEVSKNKEQEAAVGSDDTNEAESNQHITTSAEKMAEPDIVPETKEQPANDDTSITKVELDHKDATTTNDEQKDTPNVEDAEKKPVTFTEEVEKTQSTKRHIDEIGGSTDDEETLAAKKLKTIESGDQEVPIPPKKVMCEE